MARWRLVAFSFFAALGGALSSSNPRSNVHHMEAFDERIGEAVQAVHASIRSNVDPVVNTTGFYEL